MAPRDAIRTRLTELFDAERRVRRIHDELCESAEGDLCDTLAEAITAAGREPEEEASLRLSRIAMILGEVEGPRPVDMLVDVLASDHPEARVTAGEQLEELAFERFKEVALGVERALKRLPVGSPALPELPYLLAEIPEPGVSKLLGQFLGHADPDAVAAGIEALVDLGDPTCIKHLEALVGDTRTVEMLEEQDGAAEEVTIGELAEEAVAILSEGAEDGDEEEGEEPEPKPPTARRGGAP